MASDAESGGDERHQPRTSPPTTAFGEPIDRWSKRLGCPCDNCGNNSLDQWITEGATEAAAVCPACGHVHDDERTRELYERYVSTETENGENDE